MALYNYPYPSHTWAYQGVDFAGISGMSASMAVDMFNDGISFVGRYLYHNQYPNGKGISATEAQYYLDAGIKIYLYYEVNTSDALNGAQAGTANGQAASALASTLNVPLGTPIICCCDTDVTDAQASGVVMDYLQAFAAELPGYNVGIYGGLNVVSACYNLNPAYYRVQAGAWGSHEFSPIEIRQWYMAKNSNALADGYIHINNITLDSSGFAYWNGHSVDLISTPSLANMWGGSGPRTKMPIWFYLKRKYRWC